MASSNIGEVTVTVRLDGDAVEVLDDIFQLIDELEDLAPEWAQFELDKLRERRQALADRATELLDLARID